MDSNWAFKISYKNPQWYHYSINSFNLTEYNWPQNNTFYCGFLNGMYWMYTRRYLILNSNSFVLPIIFGHFRLSSPQIGCYLWLIRFGKKSAQKYRLFVIIDGAYSKNIAHEEIRFTHHHVNASTADIY